MDLAQYRRINNIIERDSADATYKYALLRGVIEICQQSSLLAIRQQYIHLGTPRWSYNKLKLIVSTAKGNIFRVPYGV